MGIENVNGVATLAGAEGIFYNILNAALGLAGVALFVMLLVGGFRFLTAGGDPKNAEAARKTLTSAILGLVLVALAYLILRFIGFITGAEENILEFRIFR